MQLIKELSFQDVLYELMNRTFCEDEMIELLKWWTIYNQDDNNRVDSERTQFMQWAILPINNEL